MDFMDEEALTIIAGAYDKIGLPEVAEFLRKDAKLAFELKRVTQQLESIKGDIQASDVETLMKWASSQPKDDRWQKTPAVFIDTASFGMTNNELFRISFGEGFGTDGNIESVQSRASIVCSATVARRLAINLLMFVAKYDRLVAKNSAKKPVPGA